ncbi:MAG: hypothetical protein MR902_00170 [Campylobacter sp.]|nr:hypothetical protein [Campylobacter sp.]
MRIENLVRLVNGTLLTNPKISAISHFEFDAKKAVNDTAFIALNASLDNIDEAVKNGAYAVIFDNECRIISSEIAYIKVSNLQNAIIRIANFICLSKKHKFIFVNKLQWDLLEFLGINKKHFLISNLKDTFTKISSSNSIFFVKNSELLSKLSFDKTEIKNTQKPLKILNSTIFTSRFIYDNEEFILNLPQIFIKEFCAILECARIYKLEHKINPKLLFNHFEPLFVCRDFRLKNYGESYRALIVESDKKAFEMADKFLRFKFRDGIKTTAKASLKSEIKVDFYYQSLSDIKKIEDFLYLLVFGDKNEIITLLSQDKAEASLF